MSEHPEGPDCLVVTDDMTRDDLLDMGVTEAGADEIMAYREYLSRKERGEIEAETGFHDWWEANRD